MILPKLILSSLYLLEVMIKAYVSREDGTQRINVSKDMEFVWITEPAKIGNIAQEIRTEALL